LIEVFKSEIYYYMEDLADLEKPQVLNILLSITEQRQDLKVPAITFPNVITLSKKLLVFRKNLESK